MASTFRKKQKAHLIAAIICCALVVAAIVVCLVINLSHRNSVYNKFADKNFADALASALGYNSHYDIKQEDLDNVESLVYFCQIGIDSSSSSGSYASYAYPVVMLGDATYTDSLLQQSDPDYEAPAETPDYSSNYKVANCAISDPADLNLFKNLRILRAFDSAEVSSMVESSYYTTMYSYYGMCEAISSDTVINTLKLKDLTSLEQLSDLTKLEQLSICYSGITNLNGIENFKNLKKLDATETALTSIEGLSKETELTYLALNSINETKVAASDNEASDDEKDDDKEEEKKFNETGIGDAALKEIAALSKLSYLDISGNNVSDLSVLKDMTDMRYLYIASNPVASLKGTEGMSKLKTLYASGCKLSDVSSLSSATALEKVYLSENELKNLNGINSDKVTYLDASKNNLEDASPVSKMTKVETLNLSENELTKVPDLSGLTCVKTLNLADNHKLADASGLEKFNPKDYEVAEDETLSVTLDICCNELKTLTLKAEKLTSLDVGDSALTSLDIGACTGLTSLTVSNNENLNTITGLDKLTALTTLTAEKTGIKNLPALKDLKALTTVTLNGCWLEDLSAFKDNESITTLNMKDTASIADISALSTLTALKTANFTNCTSLTDTSIADCFGAKDSLKFKEDSSLSLTLSGCTGIKDFSVFDEYGNMTVTYDKESSSDESND